MLGNRADGVVASGSRFRTRQHHHNSHLPYRTWGIQSHRGRLDHCVLHGLGSLCQLGRVFFALFVPTLLGNIVGGVTLVSALGHAQVVGGKRDAS